MSWPEDLRVPVEAVAVALSALRTDPTAARVLATLDQAAAEVATRKPDLTAQALLRILTNIEYCHRTGQEHSPQLEMACRTAAIAVQIDPRLPPG